MVDLNRTTQEKVILGISLAGCLSLLPFIAYRILIQEWLLVFVDLMASIGLLSLFLYVYVSRRVIFASGLLCAIVITAIVVSIYIKGIEQSYWLYPICISFFYLLKPRLGIIYSLITIILVLPVINQSGNLLILGQMLVPLTITIVFAYIFSKEMANQRNLLQEQATKDPLTGIGNRRALSEKMDQLIALFQRTGNKVSLLLIDADHFKIINDTYGHNTGDLYLIEMTKVIKSRIRISDSLYRFGGEEFIVVAENAGIKDALILAEELRATIQSHKIKSDKIVTISIGVAELKSNETDEQWIKRADIALYKAKDLGRNTVCAATE